MIKAEKFHSLQLAMGSVLAFSSFTAIILFTDPFQAGLLTHFVLYLSCFFMVAGSITILELNLRRAFSVKLFFLNFQDSLRHGLLVGLLTVTLLFLQAQNLLSWWNFLGLIGLIACVEFFFIS